MSIFTIINPVSAQDTPITIPIDKGGFFWLSKSAKDPNLIATVNFTCINCYIDLYVVNASNYTPNGPAPRNPIAKYQNVSSLNVDVQLTANGTYYFGFQNTDLFHDKQITVLINIHPPIFDMVSFLLNLAPFVILAIVLGLTINYLYEKNEAKKSENETETVQPSDANVIEPSQTEEQITNNTDSSMTENTTSDITDNNEE